VKHAIVDKCARMWPKEMFDRVEGSELFAKNLNPAEIVNTDSAEEVNKPVLQKGQVEGAGEAPSRRFTSKSSAVQIPLSCTQEPPWQPGTTRDLTNLRHISLLFGVQCRKREGSTTDQANRTTFDAFSLAHPNSLWCKSRFLSRNC